MILSGEVSGKIDRVCCGAVKIFMGNKSSPLCTFRRDCVCVAMKAPVGLLSGRTVLRSKMEGPCPDKFTLTHCDFCGSLSQQFNITYLLRVPARLPKEPEQVFNFLSLHNEPEPRPSRKEWSGSGCCVAIFYCQIQRRTLKTA